MSLHNEETNGSDTKEPDLFSLGVDYTLLADPNAEVPCAILKRMGRDSEAQASRRIRRVVQPWQSGDGYEDCIIEIYGAATIKRHAIRMIIGKRPENAEKVLHIHQDSSPGGCFHRTSAGWAVSSSLKDNAPRIRNVGGQILAECCKG